MTKQQRIKWEKDALSRLGKLAGSLGVRVAVAKLIFAGVKLKPGLCVYRGQRWIVLDMYSSFDDQADLYRELFSLLEFDHAIVPEDLRPLILDPLEVLGAAAQG
jgi:hypothetical protein